MASTTQHARFTSRRLRAALSTKPFNKSRLAKLSKWVDAHRRHGDQGLLRMLLAEYDRAIDGECRSAARYRSNAL